MTTKKELQLLDAIEDAEHALRWAKYDRRIVAALFLLGLSSTIGTWVAIFGAFHWPATLWPSTLFMVSIVTALATFYFGAGVYFTAIDGRGQEERQLRDVRRAHRNYLLESPDAR